MEASIDKSRTRFEENAEVVYGFHGKCVVQGIETKTVGGQTLEFYRLDVNKQLIGKPKKSGTHIWIPVQQALQQGLRAPASSLEDIGRMMAVLSSREFYAPTDLSWNKVVDVIDGFMQKEGAEGLAKSMSYIYVLRNRQSVPKPEVVRMYENLMRLIVREIADVSEQTHAEVEALIEKTLKNKLLPDA